MSLTRDVTSYWRADCTTDFLGDTFPPPPPTPLGGSESVSCHVRRKVYATGPKRPNKKLEKGTEQYLHHNTMVKENNSVHNVNSKEQDSAQTKEKKTFTG